MATRRHCCRLLSSLGSAAVSSEAIQASFDQLQVLEHLGRYCAVTFNLVGGGGAEEEGVSTRLAMPDGRGPENPPWEAMGHLNKNSACDYEYEFDNDHGHDYGCDYTYDRHWLWLRL